MEESRHEPTWAPPGPGQWHRELAHFPRGQTPVYRAVYGPASAAGLSASFARYGIPVSHLEIRHVHDLAYVRLMPLVEPPSVLAGRRPPAAAVWLFSRIVPVMRRRARVARTAWDERRWRDDARRWSEETKPAIERANLILQDESPDHLTLTDLASHLDRAFANLREGITTHFDLVAANIVPVGTFVDAAVRAGLPAAAALSLLAGSSPGSAAGVTELAPVITALRGTESFAPATLDELRAIDDEVKAALDGWLRRYGHRVVTSCDVNGPTLVELPDLVLRTVLALAAGDTAGGNERDVSLLDLVPDSRRHEVEGLLAEARLAYALRDDNASTTLSWPSGLLRRGLLAAGGLLAAAGRLTAQTDVFELQPGEVLAMLRGGSTPTAAEVRSRGEQRRRQLQAVGPLTLGPKEPLPSLDPLPVPLRRVGRAALAVYELMNTTTPAGASTGSGIGATIVGGRARVAASAEDALARIEPGDILVVPFTTPAYNSVLPVAAALVVEEGGPLSHAALVARELGVPAVIGLPGVTDRIPDGAHVEVDPVAGTVKVAQRPGR